MNIVEIKVDLDTGRLYDYWSTSEFAQICNVKDVTVRAWIGRGKVEAIKVGGELYIPKGTKKPGRKNRRKV